MSLLLRRTILLAGVGGDTPPTPSRLPEGYTELNYIEQPRGQSAWIKTGVTASNNIGFVIDAYSYDTISGNANLYGCFFGGRQSSGNNDFQLTTYTSNANTYSGTLRLGSPNNNNARLTDQTRFTATLDGTNYTKDGTTSTVTRNITSGKEIYLFALNNNGSSVQFGHFRLYSLKFTDSGTTIRDFVPCKNENNVVGLYDLIEGEFYKSQNLHTFIGG